MIAIIDYDAGNILSVAKALASLGEEPCVTRDPKIIMEADKVILPGVGAFKDAMDNLEKYGLVSVIKDYIMTGRPFLGICLGLQLLFEESDESKGVEGLHILDGKCKLIPKGEFTKIPHMGWNSLEFPRNGKLFEGINDSAYVYFVHSYYLEADDETIVTATTNYNVKIHASVEKDNIFACQFHPEKSGEVGLKILENFLKM